MASIRSNAYRNPQIGQAFGNIASLFAPPKATDVYAYAHAAKTRGEAERAAAAFQAITDPNASRAAIDQYFIGGLGGQPNQTYGVSADEIAAAAARNAADNARALDVERLQQQGQTYREFNQPRPLAENATMLFSKDAQRATGFGPTVRGNINLKPGETTVTPGGETFSGGPVPLTTDQVIAAATQRGLDTGAVKPEQVYAKSLNPGDMEVTTDESGRPIFTSRYEAAGKPAYQKPTAERVVGNYRTPEGGQGVAVAGLDGKLRDSQTNAELPPGVQTFRSQAQGKAEDVVGVSTKNQAERDLLELDQAATTSRRLRDLITRNPGSQGLVGSLKGTVQDVVATGGELGQMFNVNFNQLKQDAISGRMDPAVAQLFEGFNPNIPAAKFLELALAAQVAKIQDPSGRVSDDRLRNVQASLGVGGLANTPRTLATLDEVDRLINDKRSVLTRVAPNLGAMTPAAGGAATGGYKILNVR